MLNASLKVNVLCGKDDGLKNVEPENLLNEREVIARNDFV